MEKDRKRPRAFLYNANRSTTWKARMRWQAEWKAVLYGSCASPPLSQRESGIAVQDLLTTWTVWRIPECVASVKWTELMVRKGQKTFLKSSCKKSVKKDGKCKKSKSIIQIWGELAAGQSFETGGLQGRKCVGLFVFRKEKRCKKTRPVL